MLSLYSFVTNYSEYTASQLADLSSERALTHDCSNSIFVEFILCEQYYTMLSLYSFNCN